ncbi:uncharacterized protein LOC130788843 [Actinidia eriantha]|uniref:uncharacterized protein LOC130788843 n=1 Tax=Actinidia eriantha TaxID=165200 RepID=UPI00258F8C1B|nr:uncharacterized protein LOC130788843 [Actinidia eriantha]
MKHPLHPEHPLNLNFPLQPGFIFCACDLCGERLKAFIYHCSLCNFYLDPVCASRALSFVHESHKHPLIPQLNPASLECYACRTKDEDVSYQCCTCRFWIHQDCASLPTTIKHRGHNHPLTLSKSKLAVEVGDIDGSNPMHLPMRDELVRLIDFLVKQICLGDNEGEPELNHFSHKHPLIFFNVPGDDDLCHGNEPCRLDEENKDKICSGCDRTISTSFYSCRSCNFFLHKWCAKLPVVLNRRGLHPHPLMLCKEIYEAGRKFSCASCFGHFKGFCFQCSNPKCGDRYYYLDVKCASLPISIVHEIHEHPLLLKENCLTEGCAACHRKSGIASFGCGTCNFSLHFLCAFLPPTFRHRYDKHPFILKYSPIENGPNEYICEFCEDNIDPNYWFYHCIICDQSACAECILKIGKYFEKSVWPSYDDERYARMKAGFARWKHFNLQQEL